MNNIEKLNAEIVDHINMFKLRILENYKKLLLKELQENKDDEEIISIILKKFTVVEQRRNELAILLRAVITK